LIFSCSKQCVPVLQFEANNQIDTTHTNRRGNVCD
jgi:hypothetical protein